MLLFSSYISLAGAESFSPISNDPFEKYQAYKITAEIENVKSAQHAILEFSESIMVTSNDKNNNFQVDQPKHKTVDLSDAVNVFLNKPKEVILPNHFEINLSEVVTATSGDKSTSEAVVLAKEFVDRKAILERIFYPERIRSTKISSDWNLDYLDQTIETNSDELDDLAYEELKYKKLGIIAPTTSLQVDQSIQTIACFVSTIALAMSVPPGSGLSKPMFGVARIVRIDWSTCKLVVGAMIPNFLYFNSSYAKSSSSSELVSMV